MTNDPYANARNTSVAAIYGQAEMAPEACPNCEGGGCVHCMGEAAIQVAPAADPAPSYIRLRCIELALAAPDGASPPPLDQVMERARAYWQFILFE